MNLSHAFSGRRFRVQIEEASSDEQRMTIGFRATSGDFSKEGGRAAPNTIPLLRPSL